MFAYCHFHPEYISEHSGGMKVFYRHSKLKEYDIFKKKLSFVQEFLDFERALCGQVGHEVQIKPDTRTNTHPQRAIAFTDPVRATCPLQWCRVGIKMGFVKGGGGFGGGLQFTHPHALSSLSIGLLIRLLFKTD